MFIGSSALLSVMVAVAAWPAEAGDPAAEPLRISGTGSSLGVLRRLADAYQKRHPGQTVRLLPSLGSAGAIQAVAEGALDLGIAGRPFLPAERDLGLVSLAFARTPFVFAVGPKVTATSIGPAELARIYRGETLTWPDGTRIRLVLRPRADVDTAFVRAISPELDAAVELAMNRDGMLMAATNQDCGELLARTPGSIGPSTLTQLVTETETLRALAWNGVAPTLENLASGAYPLVKTLRLVMRGRPTAAVQSFVDFMGSPEARRIVERAGNLPVEPAPAR